MIVLSRHAEQRCQQRGVTAALIEAVLRNADVEFSVGGNCTLLRVSKRRARTIGSPDRLNRVALIWSDHTAQVVTVLALHDNASGRRYRARH